MTGNRRFQLIPYSKIKAMSAAMDKALMAMSLEEEDDVPFVMPDLPEYSSTERNKEV